MPQHPVTSDETARQGEAVPTPPASADAGPTADPGNGSAVRPPATEDATVGEPAAEPPSAPPAEPMAEPLSDDTRPVPRDRGPLSVDPPAASPTAVPPAAPAAAPTAEDVPAGAAQSAPAEPDWDRTADIRFAPGQAPGQVPAAEPAAPAATAPAAHDTAAITPAAHDTAAITPAAHDTAALTPAAHDTAALTPAAHDTAAMAPARDTAATTPADRTAVLTPGAGGDGPRGGGPGGPGGDRPGPYDGPAPAGPRRPWWRRPAVLTPAAALVVLGGAYGVDLLVAGDDVPRNTVVAGVDIGGLSPAAAADTLERELTPRVTAERTVVAGDVTTPFLPADAGVGLDVPATVDAADDQPLNPWSRLVSLFSERDVDPVLSGVDTGLDAIAAQVDQPPVDASIMIDGMTPSVVPPVAGRELDREGAARALTTALSSDADPGETIELPVEEADVRVTEQEAQRVLDGVVAPGLAAPVTVTSQDGSASVEVPVEAIAASLTFAPQDDGTLAVAVDPRLLAEAMGEDLTAFGTPAQDAGFELVGDTVQVVPSVDGTGIDPAALATQLVDVLPLPAPREVTAELGPVPADLTTEEAQALGVREEISSFTTTTGNSASGTNIRVVAEEVDGAVVLPGETFSLNTYTGPRGTAQGYVPANVISGGQLSTAVGGGISQFATTMFNAVFFAGLEDVYHKPHTFYISRYPAGREATVYEGQIDLQWRNDTDTGVFVDTSWAPGAGGGGSVTVTFYGTKRYEIEAVEGPRSNYREPDSLQKPDDGSCIPQTGVRGFDVTVTRIFRDLSTGAEIRRETFNTSYQAEDSVTCVPVEAPAAPADPAAPPASGPAPAPGPAGRRPGGRRAA